MTQTTNHHSTLEPCPFCGNLPQFAIIQSQKEVVSWYHCDSYDYPGHGLSTDHHRISGTYTGAADEDLSTYRNPARIRWNEMINLAHRNLALEPPHNELVDILSWDVDLIPVPVTTNNDPGF